MKWHGGMNEMCRDMYTHVHGTYIQEKESLLCHVEHALASSTCSAMLQQVLTFSWDSDHQGPSITALAAILGFGHHRQDSNRFMRGYNAYIYIYSGQRTWCILL